MPTPPLLAAAPWPQLACGAIWVGLVVLTVALPIVLRSKWGAAEPLRRCFVLSIWAHVLLAAFATTVPVVRSFGPVGPGHGNGVMHVTMIPDGDGGEAEITEPAAASALQDPPPELAPIEQPQPAEAALPELELTPPNDPVTEVEPPVVAEAAAAFPPLPEVTETPFDSLPPAPEPILEPAFEGVQSPEQVNVPSDGDSEGALVDVAAPATETPFSNASITTGPKLPHEYEWRRAGDKAAIVAAGGGSGDTEAAVAAALAWLASVQARDGRWDADQHGAGRGAGQDATRAGAGIEADTGVTALALLTFLAAGHTHKEGDYQETVQRGLQFLVNSQAENGNLAGRADVFAGMYCHGMSGVALAEAYGMTADLELRRPVERAVMYTLAAQHPRTGGWRYRPGDLGDTSQLGWQLMLLRSARIAGLEVPEDAFVGAGAFLRYVSAGQHGGLAAYRFNEQISSPMTAEALACRQFLGLTPDSPTAQEAGQRLLGELPGTGNDNFYYWYYGTLAMHNLGGDYWDAWNRALQTRLLNTQTPTGPYAGSWNPDNIWGGYGGRIYSTALATLSLEVYYRYLPMVNETAAKSRHLK
jgi:hypothetical protein